MYIWSNKSSVTDRKLFKYYYTKIQKNRIFDYVFLFDFNFTFVLRLFMKIQEKNETLGVKSDYDDYTNVGVTNKENV